MPAPIELSPVPPDVVASAEPKTNEPVAVILPRTLIPEPALSNPPMLTPEPAVKIPLTPTPPIICNAPEVDEVEFIFDKIERVDRKIATPVTPNPPSISKLFARLLLPPNV